jgi:hypothetical protein
MTSQRHANRGKGIHRSCTSAPVCAPSQPRLIIQRDDARPHPRCTAPRTPQRRRRPGWVTLVASVLESDSHYAPSTIWPHSASQSTGLPAAGRDTGLGENMSLALRTQRLQSHGTCRGPVRRASQLQGVVCINFECYRVSTPCAFRHCSFLLRTWSLTPSFGHVLRRSPAGVAAAAPAPAAGVAAAAPAPAPPPPAVVVMVAGAAAPVPVAARPAAAEVEEAAAAPVAAPAPAAPAPAAPAPTAPAPAAVPTE